MDHVWPQMTTATRERPIWHARNSGSEGMKKRQKMRQTPRMQHALKLQQTRRGRDGQHCCNTDTRNEPPMYRSHPSAPHQALLLICTWVRTEKLGAQDILSHVGSSLITSDKIWYGKEQKQQYAMCFLQERNCAGSRYRIFEISIILQTHGS